MSEYAARGVLHIHSAPSALCPHVEWAVASAVDARVDFAWTLQPAAPGTHRAELQWTGTPGLGAKLASTLRTLGHLRFEITEDPTPGIDGSRWSHTPELGIFHATVDNAGNIMVSEDRIRYAYELGAGDPNIMYQELSLALGEAWDEELEPFRHAAEGAPVRWLSSAAV
ncbi:DUF3145 domain-containing protein [Nesterenkonia sp. MY13]|uniref:DUF3145 domain-containing protein n=1 Tax=Nesterenkonia sedimenti TaxID=1463632 RepID=A0A7X8TJT3_9MICC|nr:DUF3145 domain-containing protein [Nesterenkonia sedimenti]NLS10086.1 DUF3145 domain-containing protein [Nesterenkonia sedimenti]